MVKGNKSKEKDGIYNDGNISTLHHPPTKGVACPYDTCMLVLNISLTTWENVGNGGHLIYRRGVLDLHLH